MTMNDHSGFFIVYMVISLLAITILAIIALKKNCKCNRVNPIPHRHTEGFKRCICGGMGNSTCIDVEAVNQASNYGNLSINMDHGAIQRDNGGPKWSTYSSSDVKV